MEGALLSLPLCAVNGQKLIPHNSRHSSDQFRQNPVIAGNCAVDLQSVIADKLRFLYESVRVNCRDSPYAHYIQSVQLIREDGSSILSSPTSASTMERDFNLKCNEDDYIQLSTLFSPHLYGLRTLTRYFQTVRNFDEKQVIVLRRIGPLGFENGMILFDRITEICNDLSDETTISDLAISTNSQFAADWTDSVENHACIADFQLLPHCSAQYGSSVSNGNSAELKPSTVAFVALRSVEAAQKFLLKYANSGLFIRNYHVLVSSFTY